MRIRVGGDDEIVLGMNRSGLIHVKDLVDRLAAHPGADHHFHLDTWTCLEPGSKSIVLSLLPDSWFDEHSDLSN